MCSIYTKLLSNNIAGIKYNSHPILKQHKLW